jgi:release factor glutamine methyltransferase
MLEPVTSPFPAVVDALRAAGCVFAEDEARLLMSAADRPDVLASMVARRVAGDPLEQILGWAEFCGTRVVLEPGVFVPRQRTRLLVERATPLLRHRSVLVDLCCGSGALGLVLAKGRPDVELHAADIDPVAVRCARRNLAGSPGASVHEGDLFEALPDRVRGRVDVVVTVTPYVPSAAIATMPPEARDHEPRIALDGGSDGLDVLRRAAAAFPAWAAPGAWLLTETGADQAPIAVRILDDAGFAADAVISEDIGATVVVGQRP